MCLPICNIIVPVTKITHDSVIVCKHILGFGFTLIVDVGYMNVGAFWTEWNQFVTHQIVFKW